MKIRFIPLLLAVILFISSLSPAASAAQPEHGATIEPMSSFITSPTSAKGSDYSTNDLMISKLNSIFAGNAGITTSSGSAVNVALGTSNVPDNNVTLYACNRLVSGTSCWIYGNAVYYTLFSDVVANGQMTYHCTHSEKIGSGISSASYDVFKNAGVRQGVGAYIRTTTHTVIVLDYSTSGISILEGNANGAGLVRISNYSWAEFNSAILKNGNKPIQYIVQPTDSYYNSTYPSCDHTYAGEGICSKCGYRFPWENTKTTSCAGIYKVTLSGGTYPRPSAPYSDAAKSSTLFPYGAQINVSYGVTNAYGNTWYYATYNGVSGFVNEDNVSLYSRPTQQFTCTISSPAEGAVVPKSAYPVIGTLTSQYYQIKEVKAYIDGSCYATVSNVNSTSLELRPTAINQNLNFASLSSGRHVLRIDARDSQSSSFVTVINRTFYTETTSVPTNATVVTDKSSYTLGETVTITPSASGATGYNVSVWLGEFGNGEQVYSNYDEFVGSVSFKPEKVGTYTVRASCINSAGYVDAECNFTVTSAEYFIDLNALINGNSIGSIPGYGTVDVYINGNLVADDVSDYYTAWPTGTTYEFKDIRPVAGYSYDGIHEGLREGVVKDQDICVVLEFSKIDLGSVKEQGVEYVNNGHKYIYFSTPLTWYAANEYCKSIGGHLVTIMDASENEFVRSMIKSGEYVWLGATDENHEGEWSWVTGEPFDYSDWYKNQPDNASNYSNDGEDFVHYTVGKQWNDGYGDRMLAFICEFEDCIHSYTASTTAPSCAAQGYTTHTCIYCGHSYIDSYTNPTGHSYTSEVAAPTCTEQGYTTYTCINCGDSYVDSYTPASCPGAHFTDMPAVGHWAHASIDWAVANGITNGTSATKFSPNADCTRGQIVTFLWRAAGEPEPTATNNPFTDVDSDDFYYKAVLWAVENGITTGASATKFNPKGACNRAQVVTFMWRAKGSPTPTSANNPFGDVPADKYYHHAVLWAVENGITTGTSATKFAPNSTCTRGQIVTFLYRGYAK